MKRKIGCGKMVDAIWNFGRKVKLPCGFEEEGFMPLLCDDCKQIQVNKNGGIKDGME